MSVRAPSRGAYKSIHHLHVPAKVDGVVTQRNAEHDEAHPHFNLHTAGSLTNHEAWRSFS